ncbi:MAG: DNA/RNA nuclease SfsA [Clostridia bacterium]|nr:DNA/RNA nuclease SfsA [Clostridia bacterium]
MIYSDVKKAVFLKRPNRFIAHVLVDGQEEIVHVKNTGRCREILIEGTPVLLEKGKKPDRKTKYSLICAYKGDILINIDSQVPNRVVFDAIKAGSIKGFESVFKISREVAFGNSRFDIYYENPSDKGYIEVKGVTLERDGIALFPDAPTERGAKHIHEMIKAVELGYRGSIFFLIQLKGVSAFTPNAIMDKEFADALIAARKSGVQIIAYDSVVTENSITIGKEIEVVL